jgi:hypothetical protein
MPVPASLRLMQCRHGGRAPTHASWEELSDNYLLGFSFWQGGAPPNGLLLESATWLKSDPQSPWKTIRWS